MMKKVFTMALAVAFVLTGGLKAESARATAGSHVGEVVKMQGYTTLYYVANDGRRYVFPNERNFKSWFPDYTGVVTLTADEIANIPLAGNVVYRPGVLLLKIDTDPKVYAVSRMGILRWVTSETIARTLYGDSWNLLIDDVPDSFFTNYSIGEPINNVSEFNPEQEIATADTIEGNRGMNTTNGKRARTKKCQMTTVEATRVRDCTSTSTDTTPYQDTVKPYITSIKVTNGGETGWVDEDDSLAITFSEAIDPDSITTNLDAGDDVSGVLYSSNGGVSISSSGKVTIKNIATFELGDVEQSGNFTSSLALNAAGTILTITFTSGNEIEITEEDLSSATQIGGTIKDLNNNTMDSDDSISDPTGTFGGSGNSDDEDGPYITSIKVTDGGEEGVVDEDDTIAITFNEAIEPTSINDDLEVGDDVSNVDYSATGGVGISTTGKVTIKNIATFDLGDVDEATNYTVKLALNSTGKILTITLTDGSDLDIVDEDFGTATQIGGTVEDLNNNEMASDSSISDPTGTFGGGSETSDADAPYITAIKVTDSEGEGFVDEGDAIAITFNEAVDPETINDELAKGDEVTGVSYSSTGGVSISTAGKVTIKNIAAFDLGSVEDSGNFYVDLALNSTGKILTITLASGSDLEISDEDFSGASQTGGTVKDADGTKMISDSSISDPTGTFGGEATDEDTEEEDTTGPEITSMRVSDGGDNGFVDEGDTIVITFSEAIDPETVHHSLFKGSSVDNVASYATAGVTISSTGKVTIQRIATFDLGSVELEGEFAVDLALNSAGTILTITLADGNAVEITDEDFSSATQIGGFITDQPGNGMVSDSSITDPTGTFGGD